MAVRSAFETANAEPSLWVETKLCNTCFGVIPNANITSSMQAMMGRIEVWGGNYF